jgi:glyoxylase-like metal-dependent hydrolase (beta-lactamase superfamily II)
MEIAPGIRRVGNGLVNVYLIEEAGEVTIVDAGISGLWHDVAAELTDMGHQTEDIKAIVLTHAHSDHVGFAERVRREQHVPVHVHEADAALARGETKPQNQQNGKISIGPLLRFLFYGMRRGALRTEPIKVVATFGDGATLDLPGAPKVILLPGHTPGSAALHVPSHRALFIGDAIATLNVMSGQKGPQIAPFGSDNEQALASLARLDGVEAGFVLPGHGPAWTGGVAQAVAAVRAGAAAVARSKA